MMTNDCSDIKSQCRFCTELLLRLNDEIDEASSRYDDRSFEHYTRFQNDIVRIRRELNNLRIMLNPWEGR